MKDIMLNNGNSQAAEPQDSNQLQDQICGLVATKAAASERTGSPMSAHAIAKMALDLQQAMGVGAAPAAAVEASEPEAPTWKGERAPDDPACSVEESVQPDGIICLENGRKFSMMRRHLKEAHGMTPEEYRLKWGLPADYPMTAPNYAAKKSKAAKQTGLGRHRRNATADQHVEEAVTA